MVTIRAHDLMNELLLSALRSSHRLFLLQLLGLERGRCVDGSRYV